MNWVPNINDFDLCEEVYSSISEMTDDLDDIEEATELSREEKVVAYIWGIGGFVDTNGFGGLWSLAIDYEKFAEALSMIGREKQGKVVLDSLRVFGKDPIPLDGDEVEKYFGGDKGVKDASRPFQEEYWNEGETEKPLATYIRNHQQIFSKHLRDND